MTGIEGSDRQRHPLWTPKGEKAAQNRTPSGVFSRLSRNCATESPNKRAVGARGFCPEKINKYNHFQLVPLQIENPQENVLTR